MIHYFGFFQAAKKIGGFTFKIYIKFFRLDQIHPNAFKRMRKRKGQMDILVILQDLVLVGDDHSKMRHGAGTKHKNQSRSNASQR